MQLDRQPSKRNVSQPHHRWGADGLTQRKPTCQPGCCGTYPGAVGTGPMDVDENLSGRVLSFRVGALEISVDGLTNLSRFMLRGGGTSKRLNLLLTGGQTRQEVRQAFSSVLYKVISSGARSSLLETCLSPNG